MKIFVACVATAISISACASTSVTPVARNQVVISTSAAPACGRSGAAKVAAKMAAVETLRRGYERYMIVGGDAANNTQVITTGPTYAHTTSNATAYGNTAYGTSTTRLGGQQTMVFGGFDRDLNVVMFNRGEPGFNNAIDAKVELGPEWKTIAEKGIKTCS